MGNFNWSVYILFLVSLLIFLGISVDFLIRRWIDYGHRKKDTLDECRKIH